VFNDTFHTLKIRGNDAAAIPWIGYKKSLAKKPGITKQTDPPGGGKSVKGWLIMNIFRLCCKYKTTRKHNFIETQLITDYVYFTIEPYYKYSSGVAIISPVCRCC
jgi:hypothetical protein